MSLEPQTTTPAATTQPTAKSSAVATPNPKQDLVKEMLGNSGGATTEPKITSAAVDDDPDTVDDDDITFASPDLEEPSDKIKEQPAAPTATTVPAQATPQAPAGAPATPAAVAPATVVPAATPAAEPANIAQPAAQPSTAWVPPNLFEAPTAQPTVPATPAAPAQAQAPVQPAAATQPVGQPQAPAAAPVREQYLGELEKYYAPRDEEEVRALSLEPEKVLPRMFARAHVDVLDAVVQGITNELPRLIEATINRRVSEVRASKAFYEAWPKLAETAHTPVVQRLMQTYRAQFPQANMDDMIRDVGAAAMVHLRLPVEVPVASTPAAAPSPAVRPAMPGSGTGTPRGQSTNPFESFAEELIRDDVADEA